MSDETYTAGLLHGRGDAPGHLDAATVAAYIDHRLSPAQTVSVEAHLADCGACRAEVVQLDGIVRPRRARPRAYFAGLALAAAAALVLFVLPNSNGSQNSDSLGLRIRALGEVTQPPIYLGVSVRATSDSGAALFAAGMNAYNDARYTDAVTALKAAQAAGIEGAATPFFLGASVLMLDDARGAAAEFARVIGMGETPYLAEAHYYRAKALLRMNQSNDATAELDHSIRVAQEPIKSAARALQDSVRLVRAR